MEFLRIINVKEQTEIIYKKWNNETIQALLSKPSMSTFTLKQQFSNFNFSLSWVKKLRLRSSMECVTVFKSKHRKNRFSTSSFHHQDFTLQSTVFIYIVKRLESLPKNLWRCWSLLSPWTTITSMTESNSWRNPSTTFQSIRRTQFCKASNSHSKGKYQFPS